jgi:hypothetical protein
MNPEQALGVLSQATEPNVKLTRNDYVLVAQALEVLVKFVRENSNSLETPKGDNA